MSGYHELQSTRPPVDGPKQPRVLPSVSSAACLALGQVVLGIALLSLGSKVVPNVLTSWVQSSGAGIWIGIWVCFAGVVGLVSSRYPSNGCLQGAYMAMNIVTTIADFAAGAMIVSGYMIESEICMYTRYCGENMRYYSILIGLAVIEWVVALTAAIVCCSKGCCGAQQGAVLQQAAVIGGSRQEVVIVSHTNIGMVGHMPSPASHAYPAQEPYPVAQQHNTGMAGQIPPQTSYGNPAQQPYPGAQPYATGPHVPTNYQYKEAPGIAAPMFPATAQSGLPSQSNFNNTQQPSNYHHSQPATWTTFSTPAPPGNFPSQPTASNTHAQANMPQIPAWSTSSMTGYPGGMAPPPYAR